MNFGLGQTAASAISAAKSQPIRFLLGAHRRLACGRIPSATAACLFTNKVKQKSEVSFRSAKVNPMGLSYLLQVN